ncbi:MAG: response regulator [Roseobacter sp.]
MLIKFSVLWVEDNDAWYNSNYTALQDYLKDLGFHLNVERVDDPEHADWEHLLQNTSQYDLMLIDWRVKKTNEVDKPVGGEVIEEIREHVPYSDIIFYSGDNGLEEEVKDRKLQGVYTSNRRGVLEDAMELIDHLLHKTLHPKIMRGMIVSSLSEIDEMCFKIIKYKYATSSDKAAFAKALKQSLIKQGKDRLKQKEKLCTQDDSGFIEELRSTLNLESLKRAQKVAGFLKGELNNDDAASIEGLPQTVQKRNCLAHWKHLQETDTQITLEDDGKNYVFDQGEAAQMRKSINDAGDVLTKYLEAIATKTANA